MTAASAAFGDWLQSDWRFPTEAEARRRARPALGVVAWLVYDVLGVTVFHTVTTIGLPLVGLMILQRRGVPPRWALVVLPLVMALLCVAGWTNGLDEWASGRAQ